MSKVKVTWVFCVFFCACYYDYLQAVRSLEEGLAFFFLFKIVCFLFFCSSVGLVLSMDMTNVLDGMKLFNVHPGFAIRECGCAVEWL